MMINPPIQELVNKTGNRYILVIEAAKRARQLLVSGKDADANMKPVSRAVDELYSDELKINYPREYFQTSEK